VKIRGNQVATLATLDKPAPLAEHAPRVRRWRLQRFIRNRLSLIGLVMLLILVFGALAGPAIARSWLGLEPNTLSCMSLESPSRAHPLGCDPLGRDILARLLAGGLLDHFNAGPRILGLPGGYPVIFGLFVCWMVAGSLLVLLVREPGRDPAGVVPG